MRGIGLQGVIEMRRTALPIPTILILILLVLLASCSQQKTEWKGTIEEIDRVTIVQNPKEPMYGEDIFVLEEELSIGEGIGREDYMFSEVIAVATDDADRIYVLDYEECNVKIYDKNGNHIKTFGNRGQGPGDLYLPRNIAITKENEIVVKNFRNFSFFSLDGEYKRTLSTAKYDMTTARIDSDGNILGVEIVRDEENPRYELKKLDSEANYVRSVGSSLLPDFRQSGFNPFFPVLRWTIINGNQIVFGYMGEYEIKVFDADGNLIRKISKEYTPVEVTEKDAEERLEGEDLPPQIMERLILPEHHCPFSRLYSDDEGRIFVMTYERTPDGAGYYFDVFDAQGRFIVKVPFENRPELIKKGKLYTIEEDEEGYHVIKRYRVTWKI
jgi:hypothetical protein